MKKILIVALLALAGCTTQTTKNGSEGNVENRAKLHTELAAAYYAQGQMAIALDEFNKATQLDADYAPAYTGLGLVHAALKQDVADDARHEQEIADYEKLLAAAGRACQLSGDDREWLLKP